MGRWGWAVLHLPLSLSTRLQILNTGHNPPAPTTPAPAATLDLANEISTGLPLILPFGDAGADLDHADELLLDDASDALYLVAQVPRAGRGRNDAAAAATATATATAPGAGRARSRTRTRGEVGRHGGGKDAVVKVSTPARGTRVAGVLGIAVGFLLDPACRGAVLGATALEAPIALPDAGAEAAEGGSVAGSPAPDAVVGGVGAAQAAAAWLAEEDAGGGAGTDGGGDGGIVNGRCGHEVRGEERREGHAAAGGTEAAVSGG
ncbi:MAG: hypothetical protein M1818_002653 [Claussenomyces sp. TS43310]|nr:MAG: hypothetical protein M1818_002653 [Claussenomyces sp. TS43310]